MTGLVVVFVFAVGALGLAALKSWRRCPVCGYTFASNAAVVAHLRKAHRS